MSWLHPLSSKATSTPMKGSEALTQRSAASRDAAIAVHGHLPHPAGSLVLQGPRARLSQALVGLWADEYGPALALLRRLLPPGLMRYLNVRQEQPAQAQVGVALLIACTLPTLFRLPGSVCILAKVLATSLPSQLLMTLGSTLLLCLHVCIRTSLKALREGGVDTVSPAVSSLC